MVPGEVITQDREIELNADREVTILEVSNIGDRPIQVGSHYHFFEVNRLLSFRRENAYGMRLDIPSGTSIRFEPGETRTVQLVSLGGRKKVFGLNNLTGTKAVRDTLKESLKKAKAKGFNNRRDLI